MKTILMTISVAALLLATSCKENNEKETMNMDEVEEVQVDETETEMGEELAFTDATINDVWDNYLELKTAFVESNSETAKNKASAWAQSIREKDNQMKAVAQQIADTDDLEKQRTLFSELTQQVEVVFKNELDGGTIYKQYCPIAFDNQGAYWLSDVEEIRNPYFGDKMLKCGKVTETIN